MSSDDSGLPALPSEWVSSYLKRIGVGDSFGSTGVAATVENLRTLHRAHLRSVPFENFDVHLLEPIELDPLRFVDKIVSRHRGGFCYELNGSFASLLSALGYVVELVEGQVYGPHGLTERFGHMLSIVHVDGGEYLADVGFGRGSPDEPLNLNDLDVQVDTAGMFELKPFPQDNAVDLVQNGVAQYRIASRHRALKDFSGGCEFHRTSPNSPHVGGMVCTLRTPDGRITLAGRYLIQTVGEERTSTELDRDQFDLALSEHFGIDLPPSALDRLFNANPYMVTSPT